MTKQQNAQFDDWNGEIKNYTLHKGNCIDIMASMPENCIDSIVTDPPYMINLANKKWDAPFDVEAWAKQCFRVLKHGGHMTCFGATRTIHHFATALENAGFEVRDMLTWVYWEGMPHSHDVSIAIDKALGVESTPVCDFKKTRGPQGGLIGVVANNTGYNDPNRTGWTKYKASSELGRLYDGFGTGLKPCHEPILLLRKPIDEKNIAENIIKHGTGAINIEKCRHAFGDPMWLGPQKDHTKAWQRRHSGAAGSFAAEFQEGDREYQHTDDISDYAPTGGRWPANVIHSPKPKQTEKDAGLDHLLKERKEPAYQIHDKVDEEGRKYVDHLVTKRANIHLTVKPLSVMRWLCRLVTPPNGTVLDPFMGSGTTGAAAILEGFDTVGCELTEKYWPIIEGRLEWARHEYKRENAQLKLF